MRRHTFPPNLPFFKKNLIFRTAGVGIDGGNGKELETNGRSIHLIKQTGKVKALDEEIHSKSFYRLKLRL